MTILPTLGGTLGGYAFGVNDAGQVIGDAYVPGNTTQHAFLYSGGTTTDLTSLLSTSTLTLSDVRGINDSGQIAGTATTASGYQHAVVDIAGALTDLGTLGGNSSEAFAINDAGQVSGISDTAANVEDIFLYSDGSMLDLGPAGFTPTGVYMNDLGQVVSGYYLNLFLYSGGTKTNLYSVMAPLHWLPYEVCGTNDSGQIVGFGADENIAGEPNRAFILTPTVPEPAALSLLAIAPAGLLRRPRAAKTPR
ncbi:MAG: hypothetical protein ABSD28_07820 [Tepidisphaeraceae bacterium]|jgi:probable HAF family extracellular repeat protein